MERTIIQGIKRLRVLTPYDYDNMDELVQDLSNALEESSYSRLSPSKVKKGRSWKRRSKSTGNLITLGSSVPKSSAVSEDSESSLDDRIRYRMDYSANGSQPQSDSDDIKPTRYHHHQLTSWRHCPTNMVESDSVNENFHPARQHRRKRKFKRMAVDPQPGVEAELRAPTCVPSLMQKVKRVRSLKAMKNKGKMSKFCDADVENICSGMLEEKAGFCGKRKRSIRERSVECSGYDEVQDFVTGKMIVGVDGSSKWTGTNSLMEYDGVAATKTPIEASSSGLSSSESDGGILTNDEGREADDEHSDFFHEPGPECNIPGVSSWWDEEHLLSTSSSATDPQFEAILTGNFQYLSEKSKQIYHFRVNQLQACGNNREIRAGRRRLGKLQRPPFSIMSSVNEKIGIFDPMQNENTPGISLDSTLCKSSLGDIKRRRRTPPVTSACQGFVGDTADSLPEANVGNRMLKNMGWEPAAGLGLLGDGIPSPLKAHVRSKSRVLGFGNAADSSSCFEAPPPPPPPPSPQPVIASSVDSSGDTPSLPPGLKQNTKTHSHVERTVTDPGNTV